MLKVMPADKPFFSGRGMCAVLLSLCAVMAHGAPFTAPAGTGCCNVLELRQYTLNPGRREPFIALFDGTFADPLDATGMTVVGEFRDLDRPDRFVWMRGFQDMQTRAKELASFYGSDLWHAHRDEANASINDSDNVLLLEPTSSKLRFANIPPRPAATETGTSTGLVVVTLYYTSAENPAAFAELFDHLLRPHEEAAGARSLGEYVTSSQENNFPRLPVRTHEHIFVSIAQFGGAEAFAAYKARLAVDKEWTGALWPPARSQLTREPEILRLTPTPRSRLRGN